MSADKYPCIFSRQMAAIVYLPQEPLGFPRNILFLQIKKSEIEDKSGADAF